MIALKDSHIIIDTNLLISILRDLAAGNNFFSPFLTELEKHHIKSVVEESIVFEFTRGSRTSQHLTEKNTFLDFLLGAEKDRLVLPAPKEILEHAQDLAVLYSNKNPNLSKQISFTDCLIGAQLMKYRDSRLFLATTDYDDFPLFIFDRVKVITVDTEKEIVNICIYKFNESKYIQCKNDFLKAP